MDTQMKRPESQTKRRASGAFGRYLVAICIRELISPVRHQASQSKTRWCANYLHHHEACQHGSPTRLIITLQLSDSGCGLAQFPAPRTVVGPSRTIAESLANSPFGAIGIDRHCIATRTGNNGTENCRSQ